MKRKNVVLTCKFSSANWKYLQEKADMLEISASAVLRQIIGFVFKNRHYLQDFNVNNVIGSSDNDLKPKRLTLTIDSQMKLNAIISEQEEEFVYRNKDGMIGYDGKKNNRYDNRIYHANYVVSAYIKLIEADII